MTVPDTVRALDTPASRELAGLAELLGDVQTVLECCERLSAGSTPPDELTAEALWTTAVLAYARCFEGEPRLAASDVAETSLQGEVTEWHELLLRLRDHYVSARREQCGVGAAQDETGRAGGVAVTSAPRPAPDDVTVRQTGALAYELGKLVDARMNEQQELLRAAVGDMPAAELSRLPTIDLAG
ncbi:hypothetical protein LY13_001554 [Prauserella aidingensis]|uniref:hypothetical protein n=1 Tax=Prauserella aidingensis TaxID=387890 RepID=UPI0020A56A04|nr:hypothetical protein [Prauserella aidingensis]MCP2252810.1 hypothetical protein [Prauserella aidingensis]